MSPITDSQQKILKIGLASPLRQNFDYLPPHGVDLDELQIGKRVLVPFGNQRKVGMLLGIESGSHVSPKKLRRVEKILDCSALFSPQLMDLCRWSADYYQHALGDVVFGFLPAALRQAVSAEPQRETLWKLVPDFAVDISTLQNRAPRQWEIVAALEENRQGLDASQLDRIQSNWRPIMKKLVSKNWVEKYHKPSAEKADTVSPQTQVSNAMSAAVVLNQQQQLSADRVIHAASGFRAYLLDGVTGSGKTEVYLNIILAHLQRQQQALVLVPEIGLTPQLLQRFESALEAEVVTLHSAQDNRSRLNSWNRARQGYAQVVIGTRSSVLTPLPRLGVIIVDEEHDASFKQQEGFRYSARDIAVLRAQRSAVPIVLGSATPSLESLQNVKSGRYQHLILEQRAADARPPRIDVVDTKGQQLQNGLSAPLISVMREHLAEQGQVLLFLNRRGYAPVLMCHECGWVCECNRCDSRMIVHQAIGQIRCHHCSAQRSIPSHCSDCNGSQLFPIGEGTQRLEQAVQHCFPDSASVRIDRDTTRRKGALQKIFDDVHAGRFQILIGTQMLAKGHHFPNVTLVALINIDQGLYSADFRGMERMAQLLVQVAGRSGRAQRAGQVIIQTHHPDHPLLTRLLQSGYREFAQHALAERREANLPPFSYQVLIRAEAPKAQTAQAFLQQYHLWADSECQQDISVYGPIASPMERRAGRYRAQLLLQSNSRKKLHVCTRRCVERFVSTDLARKVRWSVDVDPVDMF